MKKTDIYDVAIIGGGLAGLSLAIQCGQVGYNTILFEKEKYPVHKVCGEYISLESWPFLKSLGLPLDSMNLPLIKTLTLSDNSGKEYAFPLPLGGFGISRYFLDNELFKIARALGVKIHAATKVTSVNFEEEVFTILTREDAIKAKVAIGSFGKRSNLDITWRRPFVLRKPNALNNYVGVKYHVKFPSLQENISLHNFENGYCGFSRIENDHYCLCYLTTAQNLRNCNNSVVEMEKTILFKNPQIKRIFNDAKFIWERPLVISQISFNQKSLIENHVLMLGDAAGMISPLCGNGMSMALHSSKIAFEKVRRYINGEISRDAMEKNYIKHWKKAFATRLFTGRILQKFFGGKFITSIFYRLMNRIPVLAERLIRLTHGKPF